MSSSPPPLRVRPLMALYQARRFGRAGNWEAVKVVKHVCVVIVICIYTYVCVYYTLYQTKTGTCSECVNKSKSNNTTWPRVRRPIWGCQEFWMWKQTNPRRMTFVPIRRQHYANTIWILYHNYQPVCKRSSKLSKHTYLQNKKKTYATVLPQLCQHDKTITPQLYENETILIWLWCTRYETMMRLWNQHNTVLFWTWCVLYTNLMRSWNEHDMNLYQHDTIHSFIQIHSFIHSFIHSRIPTCWGGPVP